MGKKRFSTNPNLIKIFCFIGTWFKLIKPIKGNGIFL